MKTPIINGVQYPWACVKVVALGRPITELTEIKYTTRREKDYVRAAGDQPQGIQHGDKSYKGSFSVLQSGIIALNRAAKDAGFDDITDVEFDIIVSYIPKTGLPMVIDTISFASVEEFEMGMKKGDKNMEVSLPYIALGIDYGAQAS